MENLKLLTLPELLEKYPATESVLKHYNLYGYAQTTAATLENIEASALVNQVDLDVLLEALIPAISNNN